MAEIRASTWFAQLIVLSLVASACAGILYPRETESRNLKTLDGIWQFRATSSDGIKEKWFKSRLSESGETIPMPVPSSFNDITQEKSLREHVGPVWYDRQFFVPDSWRQNSQKVWLRFGSAHYSAKVWLNGEEVMTHEIGHLPFEAEVSRFLHFGLENRITVVLDNTLTDTTIPQGYVNEIPTHDGKLKVQRYSFDFFNYAGIHRPVVLYTTPQVYVNDITTYTDIVDTKGVIYFNVTYGGSVEPQSMVNCRVTILDAESRPVGEATTVDTTGKGFVGKIEIEEANLWWPYLMAARPGYLYTLEAHVATSQRDAVVEDVYRLPIGIRVISWTNTSLLINNRPVYMRGFGRHEDSDIRGKGLDLALVTKDYNLLKWVGANSYRTSHYPYAEEIMDFADQQGIMIIDECPAVNIEKFSDALLENHKSSLTQMIQRDKNRPSVILWSVANEPRTQFKESANYFKAVVEHVKSLETTRPVTAAMITGPSDDHMCQFVDIIGFNRYNAWYKEAGKLDVIRSNVVEEAEHWHRLHNKPVIMTEYGADTMPGLHLDPSYIWSEEYQQDLFSEHFKAFDDLRNKMFFVGEMIWNFADFKTDQAITRVDGNRKGIFTRERQPKSVAYQVRERYFQLAHEIDGNPLPTNLHRYTSPAYARNRWGDL